MQVDRAVIVRQADTAEMDGRIRRKRFDILLRLKLVIDHAARIELLDHRLIFDARIFPLLVVGQQFFPRRVHVFMRADNGDQCTYTQFTLNS